MRRVLAVLSCFGVSALVVLAIASSALSQGSGSSRVDPPRAMRPMTPEEFYASFWNHIVSPPAPYNTWAALSKRDVPPRKESPHGVSTTHANKIAADDRKTFPYGSVLVREDYDEKGKRTSISVMYRVKATDPQNSDWYWLRYLENGSIAKTSPQEGNKPIAGKVASCAACHRQAGGNDLVFANDVEELNAPSKKASGKVVSKPEDREALSGIGNLGESTVIRTSFAKDTDPIQRLLKERLATLFELSRATKTGYEAGQATFAEVAQANTLFFQAELELCESDKERLAIHQKAAASAKDFENMTAQLYKTGQATQVSVLAATAHRLGAEIAFERAKAKAALPVREATPK